MKPFLPFVLILLAGCQTRLPVEPTVVPLPLAEPAHLPDARIPAVVGHYTLGAYVDPDNELIRHEGHAIQRLEAESRWNLRPLLAKADPTEAPELEKVDPAPVASPGPAKPAEVAGVPGAARAQSETPSRGAKRLSVLPEIPALTPNADGMIDLSVVPADEANPFSVRAGGPDTTRELLLGIGGLIHGATPCALINGRTVEPGEVIESLTLVRLEPDAVLFQHAGRFIRIPATDKPVRVRLPL
jgi:hypothetical protein